ncbi:uncharacterized protein G2W53_009095 [Senna tora]|uniref:Uncharacterized protein n=1 Tax=Senna tora TaxID=362788 RepID=A0A835C7C3_9FABA|nr:uncharacterized protein G2W53_009095 [Senna tora]
MIIAGKGVVQPFCQFAGTCLRIVVWLSGTVKDVIADIRGEHSDEASSTTITKPVN